MTTRSPPGGSVGPGGGGGGYTNPAGPLPEQTSGMAFIKDHLEKTSLTGRNGCQYGNDEGYIASHTSRHFPLKENLFRCKEQALPISS